MKDGTPQVPTRKREVISYLEMDNEWAGLGISAVFSGHMIDIHLVEGILQVNDSKVTQLLLL